MVERWEGGVGALHDLGIPEEVSPTVRWCLPTAAGVALGSAQPMTDVDLPLAAALGIEVARRRSGGGAVWVAPGALLWVDVLLPADHALWCPDVGQAFWWLGDAWSEALGEHGIDGEVHRGALRSSQWSRKVCFAGLGPGEVTVGGRKLVGISQRRTRAAALFQCAVLQAVDLAPLARVLQLEGAERAQLLGEVEPTLAHIADLPVERLANTLEQRLTVHAQRANEDAARGGTRRPTEASSARSQPMVEGEI